MTYRWRGKQYIVICAGGHGKMNSKMGDAVVAFRLERAGQLKFWPGLGDHRGKIRMEVAFTTAVTASPSRSRISSCDCRVTTAARRNPQSSVTRASGPSGATETIRAGK